jgi:hypothetical protein
VKIPVRWETTIVYEATIEIENEDFKAADTDMASFIEDNIDELVADYEEDYEDGNLTADVYERRYVSHTGGDYRKEDD